MLRRLFLCSIAALVAAPVALADGGSTPPGVQGWDGVAAPGGGVRYVTVGTGRDTTAIVIRRSDGRVLRYTTYPGSWGIPSVAFDGTAGGVSRDGATLVLTSTAGGYPLKKHSSFEVLSTKNLRQRARVDLQGDFAFDALSPSGSKLYLIQHTSAQNINRYVVRAYDLTLGRLLPGRIADKTQSGWVMEGMPLTRATSADGRWAYTLYSRPGGYPFVHALDTVRGVAHCIGIPYTADQGALWKLRMSAVDSGRTLSLRWRSGRQYLTIAAGTWKISHPAARSAGSSFPWWIVALCAGGGAALVAGGLLARGGRRRVARALPSGA